MSDKGKTEAEPTDEELMQLLEGEGEEDVQEEGTTTKTMPALIPVTQTGSGAVAAATSKKMVHMNDVMSGMRRKKGPIVTADWIPKASEAWEYMLRNTDSPGGDQTAEATQTFLYYLKSFNINGAETRATLLVGLNKGKNIQPAGTTNWQSKATADKLRDVDDFIKTAINFKNAIVKVGADARACTPGSIVRIPAIADAVQEIWDEQSKKLTLEGARMFQSKLPPNVVSFDSYEKVFYTRAYLFEAAMKCFLPSEIEGREKGFHGNRYFPSAHTCLTAKGVKMFTESTEELDLDINFDSAQKAKKQPSKEFKLEARKNMKAFIINCMFLNARALCETPEFRQDRNNQAMRKRVAAAMNYVCFFAKVAPPKDGFDLEVSDSPSMRIYWEAYGKVKATRRAILSCITKVGGPNTRQGAASKAKADLVQEGFQLF